LKELKENDEEHKGLLDSNNNMKEEILLEPLRENSFSLNIKDKKNKFGEREKS
jgi:hypothetical protein